MGPHRAPFVTDFETDGEFPLAAEYRYSVVALDTSELLCELGDPLERLATRIVEEFSLVSDGHDDVWNYRHGEPPEFQHDPAKLSLIEGTNRARDSANG